MRSAERRRQIASLTAVQGRVTVVELAERFSVTSETIRRDLAALDAEGSLHRIHGGAVPAPGFRTTNTAVEQRAKESLEAKRRISRAAMRLLPSKGSTVFFDAGTTTAMLSEEIASAGAASSTLSSAELPPELNIVTNSLPAAMTLADSPRCDVQLIGGQVQPLSQAIVGDVATRSLGVLRADVAFIGTNALTVEHGLTTPDAQEGAIKRSMVTHANKVVVLCDSTKFGLDYMVSFANINEIDCLVTDSDAPQSYIQALEAAGVEIIYA